MNERHVTAGKRIQRQTGRTFHLATRLLPERIRHPTYVLYGFFRIADEVVDDPDPVPPDKQRARLEELRRVALGEQPADEPVLEAFREVADRYGIDDRTIDSFVDAMAADVDTDRYEIFADLRSYMDGSAAAVGVMMTDLMDPEEYDAAVPHARRLGEAFQMTNFIRDVREDVRERDRIYLPLETFRDHDVSEEQVLDLEFDENVAAAIEAELARTERLYREAVAGIRYLPEDCQFAVLLSAVLYAEHHRLIRRRGFDVLSERPSLSLPRSLWLIARTRWRWAWNDDPVAVFRKVSAVPSGDRPQADFEPPEGLPTR